MNSLRHLLIIQRKVLISILFDTKMSSIIRNVSTAVATNRKCSQILSSQQI